jgi:hypothetical protein
MAATSFGAPEQTEGAETSAQRRVLVSATIPTIPITA